MRIESGHICKDCCYYILEKGDTDAYCCIEPLYTYVEPNQEACESYVSDNEDEFNNGRHIKKFTFYDGEE